MENDVHRHDLELCQVGQEGDVLGSMSRQSTNTGKRIYLDAEFGEFLHYILLLLQVSKFLLKLNGIEAAGYRH